MQRVLSILLLAWIGCFPVGRSTSGEALAGSRLFDRDNLVAWCIVPFDAVRRTPAQRAEMLQELGLRRCAYDWRAEHVAAFEDEILEYHKRGIEMFAFWEGHERAFELFQKHRIHPQIWTVIAAPPAGSQQEMVEAAAQAMLPPAIRTAQLGCPLGLYNHGGWSGEPANMVAVCRRLRELGHAHVGLVYNFHHGHAHIEDWAASFALMEPYLLCVNINGMNASGDPKILGLAQGEHEVAMLKVVADSGYRGPIGILNHREHLDARAGLLENLTGLEQIQAQFAAAEAEQASLAPVRPGVPEYDAELVSRIAGAIPAADVRQGAAVFAGETTACWQCHKIGERGGTVGPELTKIGQQRRLDQLVESVFWPKREVLPEFVSWTVQTTQGQVFSGYRRASDEHSVTLCHPATGVTQTIPRDEVEEEIPFGTLMPENLIAALSEQQQFDLLRFLSELGKSPEALAALEAIPVRSHVHAAAEFPYDWEPLHPEDHLLAAPAVEMGRVFDFYTKQAEYFKTQPEVPMLLAEYPGLGGGIHGHWGNRTDANWSDERWNDSDRGSVQAGVFRAAGVTVPRGVCVQLGKSGELATCFDPDTLTYASVWSGGFVKTSDVRWGFLNGLEPRGELHTLPAQAAPRDPFKYHGYYRHGRRVVFSYRIGETEYLDAPDVKEGGFVRDVAPIAVHPLRHVVDGGPSQWPDRLQTGIEFGEQRPYAIDTIEVPFDNPWKSLMFFGGHDFLSDGSAMICTMQGDVWHVSGLDAAPGSGGGGQAVWRRFAGGLHHPLGLVVSNDEVFVQGRDQLTRLHDLNGDGEADFYECFSNAFVTSPAGHDFICGLERDAAGSFYLASGNQGLVRISPDGREAEVMATGFRNPDGLALLPDGALTLPCSEGEWTPASMICAVPPRSMSGVPPHFGYGGPHDSQPPELPLAYVPRGLDNSSGGQTSIDSDKWGPLGGRGQLIHLSYGTGASFLVLRDEVDGRPQGAIVPLPGDFRAGVHRARFHPLDGQLYVSGMMGWSTTAPDDGCFQRVRYTGDPVQLPEAFHVHENGVAVTFTRPLERDVLERPANHFAQCWNYRYSRAYGSPEFSPSHRGTPGHDPLRIASAHLLGDGRTLFLELPDLQPVSQLHLNLTVDRSGRTHDLFVTVHKLDRPFERFPEYVPREKIVAAHPLLIDMAVTVSKVPNPFTKRIQGARAIRLETGANLTFATTSLTAKAGEAIELTLGNPDVVPHNWALVRPGALPRVGDLANRLISDPEALARNYIPQTEDVLYYTDVVDPGSKMTIFFQAPAAPGNYPYLCTFPGHWMVMNGVLLVK